MTGQSKRTVEVSVDDLLLSQKIIDRLAVQPAVAEAERQRDQVEAERERWHAKARRYKRERDEAQSEAERVKAILESSLEDDRILDATNEQIDILNAKYIREDGRTLIDMQSRLAHKAIELGMEQGTTTQLRAQLAAAVSAAADLADELEKERARVGRLRAVCREIASEFGGVLATEDEHIFAVRLRAALAETEGA